MQTGHSKTPFTERKTRWRGLLDLVTGCYPGFLFGGPVRNLLPVFHFHDADTAYMQPFFEFLTSNGYRTVTSEDIAAFVLDGHHPGPRTVALCFDDAWRSLWTDVYPLLRKYGLCAITYAIPGRIRDAEGVRPKATGTPVQPAEQEGGSPFVTWPELVAMHRSGHVDVQAHSQSHAMIFCDRHVMGTIDPAGHEPLLSRPLKDTEDGLFFYGPEDAGASRYPVRSGLSDARRFLEVQGRFESRREQRERIRNDLLRAREALNARLHSDHVKHLCFPWAIAGQLAERLAPECGYKTAFADRLLGRRYVRAGDPPFRLMRLKHQYIYCLPGRNRQTFRSIRQQLRAGSP